MSGDDEALQLKLARVTESRRLEVLPGMARLDLELPVGGRR